MDKQRRAMKQCISIFLSVLVVVALLGPAFAETDEAHQHPIYTCTMHPQVRSDHPGNCPICGMTLVPVSKQETESDDEHTGMTLDQFEQMAMEKNPTLAQAAASIRAAEGRAEQANLYPNPSVGAQLEELSQRDPLGRNKEHIFFTVQQQIVLGGKRGKALEVFQQETAQAQNGLEVQKLTVTNTVKLSFYRLLGIQKELTAKKKLQATAKEAAQITQELFNVGQADRPDVLEAEIEAGQAALAVTTLEQDRLKMWKELATVVGNPDLLMAQVAGSLESNEPMPEYDVLLKALLSSSYQVKAASLQVERAEAAIGLARANRIPDLTLRGGIGYNYEQLSGTNRSVGPEGFIEASIPLPLFNRNQGRIAVANAELQRAEKELERVKLSLVNQFTEFYSEYKRSSQTAEQYGKELLPRAQEAYDLYLASFRQMAAAYPQVLIAQRNRSELEVEYIKALTDRRVQAIRLQGYLLTQGALEAPPFTYSTDETSQTFE